MKKRKINLKAIWSCIALLSGFYFVIEGTYQVAIRPFFENNLVGFTPFGLFVYVVSLFVIAESGGYLYERFNK